MPEATAPRLEIPVRPPTFGRFELLETLGEGGMGRVYRAMLTGPSGFRKSVALKVLIPRDAADQHAAIYASSIRNEARLGALLRHPGLVEVYDHGVTDGIPWLAMEYVEGVDLDCVLRSEGPLPPGVVIDLGLQLCSALQYAHSFCVADRPLHLVHRDLKPANVLVDHFGRIKITDLGIARSELATVATTAEGLLKGTPTFIAPEQITGGHVDNRADLFAVGAILYEAATGQRLFRRDGMSATVAAVLAVDEILLLGDEMDCADAILPGLADVLRGCLWCDPEVRFSSADVLAEALIELSVQTHMLGGPSLEHIARRVKLRRSWSQETIATPSPPPPRLPTVPANAPATVVASAAVPSDAELPEVEPALLSRTRIRAVGWPEEPARRGPAIRARGVEGLLVAALALLVSVSGPFGDPHPVQATVVERIPMTFVGPLIEDGGALAVEEDDASEPTTHVPAPVAVTAPVLGPPPMAVADAGPARARHTRIVSRARVGTSRSFLVEGAEGLARVRLFVRAGDGPWRHEPLSRVADGYWGTVVKFDATLEGTAAYWFEVQPVDGAVYTLGSAETPWLVDVRE